MRYEYWKPAPDLRPYVASYYIMEIPDGAADLVRVEIPHLRFLLAGESTLQHGDESARFKSPLVLVCGPTTKAGKVAVSPGSVILGASITPLGWQALFGVPVRELVNRKVSIEDLRAIGGAAVCEQLVRARTDEALFSTTDAFIRSLLIEGSSVDHAFIDAASEWLLDSRSPGLDAFLEEVDLSHRQIDRLCNAYFGASPKRLHRIYRALNVAGALAWTGETDWRKAAGTRYYDQSHLIKDFKELIGCTPGEFVRGPNMMIRFDLMKRLAIPHESRLSLIG